MSTTSMPGVMTDDDLIALAATDHDPHLNTILCDVCLARWELDRRVGSRNPA